MRLDRFDPTPVYVQVAAILRARIADGTYRPGGRVPSVNQLHAEFGISTSTGQKAHRLLRAEGLIGTQIGMGSYVKREADAG